MDVSSLTVADTGTIHVKNAAGEPLYVDAARTQPVRIIVHSPGSPAYAAVESRQTARALKRMNDNEGKVTAPTAEEALAERAEDLATLTVRFENLSDGEKVGEDLFRSVYGNQKLGFIAVQVTKHLKDWGNFQAVPGAS
jgi:hypothetical protein